MERMHGIDAFSIYCETPSSSFATLKVAILEPTSPDGVVDIDALREFAKAQALRLGQGRVDRRVVRVPYDLHHPVWVVDPDFSIDDHVRSAALPAPGDKNQLCDFLSDLMGRSLDPDRPLWELWLVEGLEGGRLAVVLKMHHVLADGGTMAAMLTYGVQGLREVSPPATSTAEAIPGGASLISHALIDLTRTFLDELPRFLRDRKRVFDERSKEVTDTLPPAAGDDLADEGPGSAPFCVLNTPVAGRYRVYRYETFSLGEFKTLARHYDCTINVLVMAVISEALRRYLDDLDDVPSKSLLAAMPIGDSGSIFHATRLHHEPPHNDVSVAYVPLHQDIEDMAERIQAIKSSSEAAVGRVRRAWGKRFDNFLEFVPGVVVRQALDFVGRKQAKGISAYGNLVISNVRGPRETLWSPDGRWRMVEFLSTGNITDQGHLNVTVWSYVDNLSFSFYMRKGALPEPDKIPGYVREVVSELQGSRAR